VRRVTAGEEEDGTHTPGDGEAVVNELAELGYRDEIPPDKLEEAVRARFASEFMLVRTHLSAGRPAAALELIERLVKQYPNELTLNLHLAWCYQGLGRAAEAREVLEPILRADRAQPYANLLMAELCLAEGRPHAAFRYLENARGEGREPVVHLLSGWAHLRLQRAEEAERSFRAVLQIEPGLARGHPGLALAALAKAQHREAAEAALAAIGLQFDLAPAHYVLGVSLAALGETGSAVQAFETCLRFRPADRSVRAALAAARAACHA
jgi:tetratricopeptide (TPR) repeat protein